MPPAIRPFPLKDELRECELFSAGKRIVQTLTRGGHTAYFAGGSVRDMLLGVSAKDIDIATSATPDEVQALFKKVTDLQGKCFGVVRVMEGEEVFEIATFRTDGEYKDGRRPEEVTFAGPEEDTARRDFTINGLYFDPLKEEVIDYVGGEKDLEAKTIRAIGDPHLRFEEDLLRLFRGVRFAAQLGFEIEPETWKALRERSPDSGSLAPERVREEMVKALCTPNPQQAFDLMDEAGLFHIWLPEVPVMKGVEQPPEFHPEGDVYVHVRMMIGMLKSPDPVLALGVLFHDIAKPDTFNVDETGRIRFNQHEHIGAEKTEEIMKRLRFSNRMIEDVCVLVKNHMAFKDTMNMRVAKLKRFMARETFELEMELHRIDCLCSWGGLDVYDFLREKQEEFSHEPIKPEPMVKGRDLIDLAIKPSPTMGQLLEKLMDEQLEGNFTDREAALARARELCAEQLCEEPKAD